MRWHRIVFAADCAIGIGIGFGTFWYQFYPAQIQDVAHSDGLLQPALLNMQNGRQNPKRTFGTGVHVGDYF